MYYYGHIRSLMTHDLKHKPFIWYHIKKGPVCQENVYQEFKVRVNIVKRVKLVNGDQFS